MTINICASYKLVISISLFTIDLKSPNLAAGSLARIVYKQFAPDVPVTSWQNISNIVMSELSHSKCNLHWFDVLTSQYCLFDLPSFLFYFVGLLIGVPSAFLVLKKLLLCSSGGFHLRNLFFLKN